MSYAIPPKLMIYDQHVHFIGRPVNIKFTLLDDPQLTFRSFRFYQAWIYKSATLLQYGPRSVCQVLTFCRASLCAKAHILPLFVWQIQITF